MADTTWTFNFTSDPAGLTSTGTLDVNAGLIVGLAGNFASSVNTGAMTLLDPNAFASNDNVFNNTAPWVTQNGFSFAVNGSDYNIYYATTTTNYGFTICQVGETCITGDPSGNPGNIYGVPSTPINFSASVPEPTALLLLGMMCPLVLGLKRKLG
jgi:hypothetical protein